MAMTNTIGYWILMFVLLATITWAGTISEADPGKEGAFNFGQVFSLSREKRATNYLCSPKENCAPSIKKQCNLPRIQKVCPVLCGKCPNLG